MTVKIARSFDHVPLVDMAAPAATLSALAVFLRLDQRRAAAVAEIARLTGADNPEVIRRMIDFWIESHAPKAGATAGLL